MFAQLREFIRGLTVPKTATVAELRSREAKVSEDLRAAEAAHTAAQQAYASAVVQGESDASLTRLHRQATEHASRSKQLRDRLSVLSALIQETAERENAAETLERWRASKLKGAAWERDADAVQEAAEQLAAALERALASGLAFRESLPDRSSGEDAYMAWRPALFARYVQMHLFVKSDGKLENGVPMSVWQVAQGPDLMRRVRDSIALAMCREPIASQHQETAA